MNVVCLHNKSDIELFLRRNVYLHIYSIGDLDDFFRHKTQWYASVVDGEVQAIVSLYTVPPFPILLALSEQKESMKSLLKSILHILPSRFYAHLSPGLSIVFEKSFKIQSHGEHYKMGLENKSLVYDIDCSHVTLLDKNNLEQIQTLYKEVYPGNWFDPGMLETNQYFGIKIKNKLVSAAGIHVYSKQYKVAALGNIVTHPEYRGKGFGKTVTAKLCQSLMKDVDNIGLNVKADNEIAIAMYQKLGFKIVETYHENMIETKKS